jgi:hypothetical protein
VAVACRQLSGNAQGQEAVELAAPRGGVDVYRQDSGIFGNGEKEAQKLITREQFEEWLENCKHNQVINHRKEWENVGSLYDF